MPTTATDFPHQLIARHNIKPDVRYDRSTAKADGLGKATYDAAQKFVGAEQSNQHLILVDDNASVFADDWMQPDFIQDAEGEDF